MQSGDRTGTSGISSLIVYMNGYLNVVFICIHKRQYIYKFFPLKKASGVCSSSDELVVAIFFKRSLLLMRFFKDKPALNLREGFS